MALSSTIRTVFLSFVAVVWIFFKSDACYTVHMVTKNWTQARTTCENEDRRLLSIESQAVFKDLLAKNISRYMLRHEIWIGLYTLSSTCTSYTWHNEHRPFNWTNWDPSVKEPDRCDEQKCVRSYNTKWRTTSCEKGFPFVCECIIGTSTEDPSSSNETTAAIETTKTTDIETTTQDIQDMSSSSHVTATADIETTTQDNQDNVAKDNCSHYCSVRGCISVPTENDIILPSLSEEVKRIQQELRVIKNQTKLFLRSKVSVYEERTSAVAIGTVGIAILVSVGLFIVLLDLPNFIRFVRNMTDRNTRCP